MDSETEKGTTSVKENERKHQKRKSFEPGEKQNKKKKNEEKKFKGKVAGDFNSIVAKDSAGAHVFTSPGMSAPNNMLYCYSETVENTNMVELDASTPSSQQSFRNNDSTVIQTDTTSLFPSSPVKGMTFVRNNTPYALNMVSSVASLFQAAAQYYNTFGVSPQYNPYAYQLGTTSTALQHSTFVSGSQFSCLKPNPIRVQRQKGVATSSAGSDVHVEESIVAGIIGHPRQWEYTEYGKRHRVRAKQGLEISLMTYNILAQNLLEHHAYLYEDNGDYTLTWKYRSQLLLQELAFHSSDIMCLQEVQSNHYHDLISPELQNLGYEGVYQKRTGDKCDGCAIFFKKDKFTLVKAHRVKFNRGSLLDRDNIAVILELRPNSTLYNGSVGKLYVATTHLLFNPRRGDVKMAQLMVLFAELDKCAKLSDGTYEPIILCGDFNMEPYCYLYNMIFHGHLQYEGLTCKLLSGQKEGYYGADVYLDRDFCSSLDISDHCQYIVTEDKTTTLLKNKSSKASTRTEKKKKILCHKCCENFEGSDSDTAKLSTATEIKLPPDDNTTTSAVGANCEHYHETHRSGHIGHFLNFVPSYTHYIERLNSRVEEVTTQHKRAACTVDYIFYNVLYKDVRALEYGIRNRDTVQEGKLRLLARYGLMSKNEINKLGVLPNQMMPSDHLPIISRFLLKL